MHRGRFADDVGLVCAEHTQMQRANALSSSLAKLPPRTGVDSAQEAGGRGLFVTYRVDIYVPRVNRSVARD